MVKSLLIKIDKKFHNDVIRLFKFKKDTLFKDTSFIPNLFDSIMFFAMNVLCTKLKHYLKSCRVYIIVVVN